jgi:hypothetical protein
MADAVVFVAKVPLTDLFGSGADLQAEPDLEGFDADELAKMRRRGWVWVVNWNVPGFLPSSEPALFFTKRDAVDYAKEMASDLEEEGEQETVLDIE